MRAVCASHGSSVGSSPNHSRSCLSLHALPAEPLPPRTRPTTGCNTYWRRRTLTGGNLIIPTLEAAGACHACTACSTAAENGGGQLPHLDTWGYRGASTSSPALSPQSLTVAFPQPQVLAVARRAQKTQVPPTWRRENQQRSRQGARKVGGTPKWQTVQRSADAGQASHGVIASSGTTGSSGSTEHKVQSTFENNRMNELIGTLRDDVVSHNSICYENMISDYRTKVLSKVFCRKRLFFPPNI